MRETDLAPTTTPDYTDVLETIKEMIDEYSRALDAADAAEPEPGT